MGKLNFKLIFFLCLVCKCLFAGEEQRFLRQHALKFPQESMVSVANWSLSQKNIALTGTFEEGGPCANWIPDIIEVPEIKVAFEDDEAKKNVFLELWKFGFRVDAMKYWLSHSFVYRSINLSRLEVLDLGFADGRFNQGIYMIKVDGVKKNIVKVDSLLSTYKTLKLNAAAISYPSCVRSRLIDLGYDHIEEKDIPNIIKIVDAVKVSEKLDICIQVQDLASGESLREINKQIHESRHSLEYGETMYEEIGKKISVLHILGWSHKDLNGGNVFYDIGRQTVSLIDNDGLNISENWKEDINQLILRTTENIWNRFQRELVNNALENYDAENIASNYSGKISPIELKALIVCNYLLVNLETSVSLEKNSFISKLNLYSAYLLSFIKGYTSFFSANSFKIWIKRICVQLFSFHCDEINLDKDKEKAIARERKYQELFPTLYLLSKGF